MRTRRTFLALAAAAAAGCQRQRGETPGGTRTENRTDSGGPTTAEPTDSDDDTGRERVAWTESVGDSVSLRPTLDGDRVFVGTEGGTVAALDAADGQSEWTEDLGEPVDQPPMVEDGSVVAVSSGGFDATATLAAYDASSGDPRWLGTPTNWSLEILGVDDDSVYAATFDDAIASSGETLYAFALADGSQRWSVEVGDPSGGRVTEDRVYVPSTGAVDAVDRDGTRAWQYEVPEYQFRTLSVVDDTVALVSSDDPSQPTVRGVDAATGETRWTRDDGSAYTTAAVGDQLLVGGESVASLDPATGEQLWSADVTASLYDPPHADGTLYVAGDEAAAISLSDGSVTWRTSLDSYLARASGLLDDQLVIRASASQDDRNREVRALDTADGERAWSFTADAELSALEVGSTAVYAGEADAVVALAP